MKEKPFDAIVVPEEVQISKDGTDVTYGILSDSKEKAELVGDLLESIGFFNHVCEHAPSKSFGISNWNRCGWNPKGPKPNWATAPKDPSRN